MVNDNYLKLICEDISLDQDLEFFFKRLSENYEDIVTMVIKNNYELIPEPNIDEIKIKLEELNKRGIFLDDQDFLLNKSVYATAATDLTALTILNVLGFKSIGKIYEDDLQVLKNRIAVKEEKTDLEILTEREKKFMEWKKENNLEEMKAIVNTMVDRKRRREVLFGGYSEEKQKKLDHLQKVIAYGTRLQTTADFFANLTYEQMKAIIELHDTIEDTLNIYGRYKYNENVILQDLEKNSFNYYEKAYKKIFEQNLNEISIEDVIRKVFVVIISNKLKPKELHASGTTKTNFSIESVQWFLKYKEKELNVLSDLLFNNLSEVVTDIYKKKIKIY